MKKSSLVIALSVLVAALSGCLGGDDSSATVTPQVSSIAGELKYGATSVITVDGQALSQLTVAASGACTSLTELSGGSDSRRQFSCVPKITATVACATTTAGCSEAEDRVAVKVDASNAGSAVASQTLMVPNPQVTIAVASFGNVVVELRPTRAPVTVNNYLRYVVDGFYSNMYFHRVISGFMVQAGWLTDGATSLAIKSPTYPSIVMEAPANTGLSNKTGSIAMARSTDLNSAASQFYINTVDNTAGNINNLDAGPYAVFGHVVTGMEVVRAIEAAPVTYVSAALTNWPNPPVKITAATQTR